VKNAYEKFKRAPADGAVHLVVLEADRTTLHLHSVGSALYGEERIGFVAGRPEVVQSRANDGLFCRDSHSRLGGVLVARRAAYRLFVPYRLSFFPNPAADLSVVEVVEALGGEAVFGPNDYP